MLQVVLIYAFRQYVWLVEYTPRQLETPPILDKLPISTEGLYNKSVNLGFWKRTHFLPPYFYFK